MSTATPLRRPDVRRTAADRWVGVEHEFEARQDDAPIDFRRYVSALGVGRPHFDPGDPCARRLEWGGVITADGREAEIATPPRTAGPGSATSLELDTRWATAELRDALAAIAPGSTLTGYSTHVSVECDDRRVVKTAERVVTMFAVPLMLLIDRSTSPGLLVRARRGRVEIGGDYIAGEQLRAATTFATAAITWLATADRRTRGRAHRQIAVDGNVVPTIGRFGFYVDRMAFGADLYTGGRGTPLPSGRTAGEHLRLAWAVVRPTARLLSDDDEIGLVDDIVDGRRPLPLESPEPARPPEARSPEPSPFGDAMQTRVRGDLRLSPRLVRWDLVVLEAEDVRHRGTAVVVSAAGRDAATFLDDIDRGVYDGRIARALSRAGRNGTLASAESVRAPSVHDRLGPGDQLVPAERDPVTGRIGDGGGRRGRRDKHDSAVSPVPASSQPVGASPPRRRWPVLAGVGLAVALLAGGAAWAAGNVGGDDDATAEPTVPPAVVEASAETVAAPTTTTTTTTIASTTIAPTVAPATTIVATTTVPATTLVAPLDPSRITGYALFSFVETAEVAPGLPEPLIPRPGDAGFSEVIIDCAAGRCALDGSSLEFDAAAPSLVTEFTLEPPPGSQCDFTRTYGVQGIRDDRGRYEGTISVEILPLFSEGAAGPCWGQRGIDTFFMMPITD